MNLFQFLKLSYSVPEDFILLKDKERSYTYNEFMEKVTAVALILEKKNIFQRRVAIKAYHRADTVIAFLGILLSGNCYIPISTEAPEGTIEDILGKADIAEYWTCCPQPEMKPLEADYNRLVNKLDKIPVESEMYIIFTSGSTGRPKGIRKSYESVMDFLGAYVKEFGFAKEHALGNQTPFYFDASVKDIYLSLYCKCRMVIIEESLFMKPKDLILLLNQEKISVIQWVPSALSIVSTVRTFQTVKPGYLEKVFFVGEMFAVKQLLYWMENLPAAEFVNLYGSSEMAGICAFCRMDYQDVKIRQRIPIGSPLNNSKIFLLDGHKNIITQAGMQGEIYVHSRALALGYLSDANKSCSEDEKYSYIEKSVFLTQPNEQLPESRYYRSGDLAQYDEEGRLEFLERRDFQIKHMGHRIELGEIETAALQLAPVSDACCLHFRNKITLFVVGNLDEADVLKGLKELLPGYMIPNKICIVEKIPINANGKKDRLSLERMLKERTWKR